jgi:hypothetical protein
MTISPVSARKAAASSQRKLHPDESDDDIFLFSRLSCVKDYTYD